MRIAVMVVLPWKPAAFLFSPRHRLAPEDRTITTLSRVRVALGLAIVVGVALWYRSYDRLQFATFVKNWLTTGLIAIPTVLLCMGLFVAWTRPPLRRAALRQMRWPALSVGAFIGTLALLALFGLGANYVSGRIKYYTGGVGLPLEGVAYGGVFGIWLLVFCLRSAYLVTQNWFNAVDGHLLLTPVIATVMAWLVAGRSLLVDTGGPPTPVSLVLILGGAAATTGIAAIEAWRGARRYGVTLRDGPFPDPSPHAAPDRAGSRS